MTVTTIAMATFDPGDPAQRGPEAVKLAALKANPAPTTWGYDLPYTYAYGAGVPFYVGHNNGEPSGEIYQNPALYPDGVPEPSIIYGQPENALDLNFSHAYPSMTGLTYGGQFSPFTFTGL
jgi:hypothetical protein